MGYSPPWPGKGTLLEEAGDENLCQIRTFNSEGGRTTEGKYNITGLKWTRSIKGLKKKGTEKGHYAEGNSEGK